jgi:acyl-CoA synthetase (AMP-forming)/AMP-acid ligase II
MLGPSFWLFQTASKTPQKEAILDEEVSLSFEMLYRDATGIAKWLNSGGKAEQRVMIAMSSGVAGAILYFATMFAGQVAVPIDPFLRPEQLESMRGEIDPQWVFGPSTLKKIWNDSRFLTADGYEDLSRWMAPSKRSKDLTHPDDDPSRLLNIVFTSGTAGQPKGVMLTGANLEAVIHGILKALAIDEESRIFSPLPFSHTYGLSQLWLMAKTGATLAVVPDITKMATIKKILVERHINTIAGVPYHFALLTRRGHKERLDSIRLVTIAGEAPSKPLLEKVRISYPKARIHILYGLTEASTRLTTLPSEDLERKEGSIGLPIDGVELKIIDEEGTELGPFEEGELITRGENISPGYWKDEALTRKTIINGWLHTGDIVKKDEEGYYYHVGRKDFVFKSGGEKIVPDVIERVLREIEGIQDAAVFGRKDAFIGNSICAVVVKAKASNLTSEEIQSICQTRLDRWRIPHEVVFAEEIPKSPSGKIRYDALEKQSSRSKGKENGRESERANS